MAEMNEDKKLEEYIRELLSDYTLPCSEEQKNEIINEFQHLKIHSKNIDLSLKELLKNKTLGFVLILVTITFILIYVLTKTFPAHEHVNKNITSIDNQNTTIKESSHSNTIEKIKIDSVISFSDITQQPTENTNTISSLPKKQLDINSVDDNNNAYTQSVTTLIKDSLSVQSRSEAKKKKKKRKRESITTEDNLLPVLEPKTPIIDSDNKKEDKEKE